MSTTLPSVEASERVDETQQPQMGLAARAVNIVFAPRRAYEAVVARPRSLGVILIVVFLIAAAQFVFLSTEVGQTALLDQQLSYAKAFSPNLSDAAVQQIEARMVYARYTTPAFLAIFVPIMVATVAGILLAIFTVVTGGGPTFKQMYAVVAHSYVIGVVQQVFSLPIMYMRGEMTSPTSLAVFFPFVGDEGFFHALLSAIDLFYLWSTVNVAIGVAVLYKRRTGGVAAILLGIYAVIALLIASVRAL